VSWPIAYHYQADGWYLILVPGCQFAGLACLLLPVVTRVWPWCRSVWRRARRKVGSTATR
jgi:hypothetical protein